MSVIQTVFGWLSGLFAFAHTPDGTNLLLLVVAVDHALASSSLFKNSSTGQFILDLIIKGVSILQNGLTALKVAFGAPQNPPGK